VRGNWRRPVEIATSAVFEIIDDSTVLFTGQAKVKGRGDVGAYPIPTLCDAEKVIAGLARLRNSRPELWGMESKLFHNRISKDLNVRVRKEFSIASKRGTRQTHTTFVQRMPVLLTNPSRPHMPPLNGTFPTS